MATGENLETLPLRCAEARKALAAIVAGDAVVVSRTIWESLISELARLRAEALERKT